MNRTGARGGMLLAVAALVFSACSSSATPVPTTATGTSAPSAAPSQGAEKTIYFGSGATPGSPEDYLIPIFTTARDNLKAQGYDLQYSSLATDEVVEAALDRSRIDVALLSMVGVQRAVKAGLHMSWIVTNETQNTFVLVVKSDVTDLTQLKGKKIGTQDPTSLATAAIPGILGPAGLKPSDYTLVNLAGSSNRAAALVAGTMDASMLLYTIAQSKLVNSTDPAVKGKWKIWGGGAAPGPALMWEGLVASDQFRKNTAAGTALVKAALDAYKKFYTADAAAICKDAVGRGLNELQGLDEGDCTTDMKLYQSEKLFPVDGGISQPMYDGMITALVQAAQMQQADAVPMASAVDSSFLAAATK